MAGKRPASIYQGTCTGHGRPVNGHVHNKGVDPCPGLTPATAQTKPVSVKDATCRWEGFPIAPLGPLPVRNVLINGIIPVLDGDVLTNHISATMHQVISACCPGPSCNPIVITAPCSMLATEDGKGKGHSRVVVATTKNVLVNGRPLAKVGDPMALPCLSKIAAGSANVLVGGGDKGEDGANKAGESAASQGTQSASGAASAGATAGTSGGGVDWAAKLAESDRQAMLALG